MWAAKGTEVHAKYSLAAEDKLARHGVFCKSRSLLEFSFRMIYGDTLEAHIPLAGGQRCSHTADRASCIVRRVVRLHDLRRLRRRGRSDVFDIFDE